MAPRALETLLYAQQIMLCTQARSTKHANGGAECLGALRQAQEHIMLHMQTCCAMHVGMLHHGLRPIALCTHAQWGLSATMLCDAHCAAHEHNVRLAISGGAEYGKARTSFYLCALS